MYLKEIRAHGFKSFADKIKIELDNKIIGIVGPNGSGKSNVVDAIKWVLGEQSIKYLRGDGNMTDVIFAGSKSRSSSNVASVTLVFDNKDHYLNLDFDEVAIKRRIYKDGTNEYFINNEKVRLKDVTNLLIDSKVGKESFNIISQGKIDSILSNKPEDRRVIFEEAAGVLKYKKRKEEALRKLDKTHLNMNRVDDIITELATQLEPLKIQREQALEYENLSKELTSLEIALIALELTELNFTYQTNKDKITALNDDISKISVSNISNETKVEEYKKNILTIEDSIKTYQMDLLNLTSEVEKINSRKTLIIERQKYDASDIKVHENLLNLKENRLKLTNEINNLTNKINILEKEIIDYENKLSLENKNLNDLKSEKYNIDNNLREVLKNKSNLKFKIENLKFALENNSTIPYSVKKVLEEKLNGVHNVVSSLFDVKEKYSTAISTALGLSMSNIVVDDEECAKKAINFLKQNNYGRATFLPLNIIKPKLIDYKPNNIVAIASELVTYDKKYSNIILNLLGNVIVVENIDIANRVAKEINYKYRIVTLDGELLHVGGSLTGGNSKNRNIITDRYELENDLKKLNLIDGDISTLELKINEIDNKLRQVEDKIYLINKEKLDKTIIYDSLKKNVINLKENLKVMELEITDTSNLSNNQLNKEEENVLNEYYHFLDKKNKVENELNSKLSLKKQLVDELSDYELSLKKENSLFHLKNNELKELEILTNRLDVKMDTLLNVLNETYSLTYEEAYKNYSLDIPHTIARTKVNSLKRQLKEIGVVNLGSIAEYERVSERYNFLTVQKDDLVNAENTLMEIISEMDKVMVREFVSTFKVIKENFSKTFKDLFKGGTADLSLTDPTNILETGIEIIAMPPGKTLKTISLLSGGEKTLTAISLLFAILKSQPVPYCVLDEVEAALDDLNVEYFGQYLQTLKDKTQFIIITHKKKTMEYVDLLYGITMQESGVSKLVSVKLEEIK